MEEETQEWIFVNRIPMLCHKKRILRQQKVETWLDLHQLMREIESCTGEKPQSAASLDYIC